MRCSLNLKEGSRSSSADFAKIGRKKQSAFSEMVGTNIPEFTQDPFVSVMLSSSSAPPVWGAFCCSPCTALPYPETPSDKWKTSPDGSQLCEGLKPPCPTLSALEETFSLLYP